MEHAEHYKSVWNSILKNCETAISEGLSFYPQVETFLSQTKLGRSEFSLGSRYMPRGFYCPSPDIECVITNMRRGKLAKQLSKRSKPTCFYMFNEEDKLFLAEAFYPNGASETEYILHKQDASYGFVYDRAGHITKVGVERYTDNKLLSYLWATCSYDETVGYKYHWIILEEFRYIDSEHTETDFYNVQIALEQIHISRWKAIFNLDEGKRIIPNSRSLLLYEEAKLEGQGDGSVVPSQANKINPS